MVGIGSAAFDGLTRLGTGLPRTGAAVNLFAVLAAIQVGRVPWETSGGSTTTRTSSRNW